MDAGRVSKKRGVRTCVACGASESKIAFARIVRRPDGTAAYDPTGREAGRGAYVCGPGCLAKARKSDKLGRALRCALKDSDYERIASEMEASASDRPSE